MRIAHSHPMEDLRPIGGPEEKSGGALMVEYFDHEQVVGGMAFEEGNQFFGLLRE